MTVKMNNPRSIKQSIYLMCGIILINLFFTVPLHSRSGKKYDFPGYRPAYKRAVSSIHSKASNRKQKALFKITNSIADPGLLAAISNKIESTQKDTISPFITGIDLLDAYTLKISFSENIDSVSGQNPENYKIFPDIKVLGSRMSSNPKVVFLYTDQHLLYKTYTLVAKHIFDNATASNEIKLRQLMYYTHHSQSLAEALNPSRATLNQFCSSDHSFVDTDFRYLKLPSNIEGTMWIREARKQNEKDSDSLLTLDINQDNTIIVGSNINIPELPHWLRVWQHIDFTFTDAKKNLYDLYFKRFEKGGIILGKTDTCSGKNIYIVMNDFNTEFNSQKNHSPKISSAGNLRTRLNLLQKSTQIKYNLLKSEKVTIQVFDSSKRLVNTIKMQEKKSAGEHFVPFWNGLDESGMPVANGIYLCKVTRGLKADIIKIAMLN